MQTIDHDALSQVTGGADLFSNMGAGAKTESNRWATEGNKLAGPFGGAFAGFLGGVKGLVQGAGHTVWDKIPQP